jgi:cytochrome b6-f complex iron-sulfur subunit
MADENLPGAQGDSSLLSRRPALARLLKAGAAAWAGGMVTPAVSYLWPALREGPGQKTVKAAAQNEIPVGASKLVQGAGKPVIVIRLGETEYRAFSAVCTHLGCLVQWRNAERDIFCPCHGGRFSLEGKVIGGPPPHPLTPYPAAVVNGDVQVKLSVD